MRMRTAQAVDAAAHACVRHNQGWCTECRTAAGVPPVAAVAGPKQAHKLHASGLKNHNECLRVQPALEVVRMEGAALPPGHL